MHGVVGLCCTAVCVWVRAVLGCGSRRLVAAPDPHHRTRGVATAENEGGTTRAIQRQATMRVSRTILAVVGVLAVAVAVSAQGDSGERDPAVIKACNEVCKQLVSPTSETYQAGRAATCSSFQRAAPRPKTGNACGDGYNIDSVKASCFAGCDREPHCELRPEDAAVAPLMSAHFRTCTGARHV